MNELTIVFNKVQNRVIETAQTLTISEHLRLMSEINGELTTFHVYNTTDNRVVWLMWHKGNHVWSWHAVHGDVPEVVKLARILLE